MSKETDLFVFFKRADFIIPAFKNPLWNKRAILSPLTGGNRGCWAWWLFLSLWWKLMKEPKLESLSSCTLSAVAGSPEPPPLLAKALHFTVSCWVLEEFSPSLFFLLLSDLPKTEHSSKSPLQMIWLALTTFRFTIKHRLVAPQYLVGLFQRDSVPPKRDRPWWEGVGKGFYERRMKLVEERKIKSKESLEEEVLRKKKHSNWCSLGTGDRAGNQKI